MVFRLPVASSKTVAQGDPIFHHVASVRQVVPIRDVVRVQFGVRTATHHTAVSIPLENRMSESFTEGFFVHVVPSVPLASTDGRDRTSDLLLMSEMLSQLSYIGTENQQIVKEPEPTVGFEPTAIDLRNRCSIQLSFAGQRKPPRQTVTREGLEPSRHCDEHGLLKPVCLPIPSPGQSDEEPTRFR